jgi:hypothetical protein
MPTGDAAKLERWARCLAVALSAAFVLLFLAVALQRLHYPFEVDRVESAMMTSVWRLRHGYPLYCAPSLTWAPLLYAPLFFYLSAALTKVMGIGYAALRAVSILSTLGSFTIIFLMVWKETRRFAACAVAVGLFASLYAFVLAWFDVGRVDSLSVFLFLLAIFTTRRGHPLLAALAWLLAFHAKQTFLPLGLAVFLVHWQQPRRLATGMIAFAALAGVSVLWLNHLTQHWYAWFAFGTSGSLGWAPREAALFVPADLLTPLPIAVLVIVAAAVLTPLRWRERDGSFFAIVTALLGAAVWFVRAHGGANINATLPLYAWIAVLLGVSVHRLLERLEYVARFEATSFWHPALWPTADLASWRRLAPAMLWLALCFQLLAHAYRPGQIIPPTGSIAVRQQLLATVRATPGDVWLLNHSYDGILAGKPMHAEMDALDAVLGRHYAPAAAEFNSLIGSQHFSAILLDRGPGAYGPPGIFTTPPFTTAYPLLAIVPGAEYGIEKDQPQFALLPCSALHATQPTGLLNLHAEMAIQSACAPWPRGDDCSTRKRYGDGGNNCRVVWQ